MTADDIQDGLRLCRASGWDQVARDWTRFLVHPSEASAAVRGDRVVGTCGAIRYGAPFAWVGMVLVDPGAQGHGVGKALLNRVIDSLQDLPSIRLDATPAGYPLYVKRGFAEECRLVRLERSGAARPLPSRRSRVEKMRRADFVRISAMDAEVFGAPRRELLEWMYDGAPEYAFVAREESTIAGYSFGRHGFAFEHVGPVVASSPQTAIDLAMACLTRSGDRPVLVDAARHDGAWLDFLERAGFTEQRPYIRMYRGGHPPFGDPTRQFAVLGPEFG